MTNNSKVIAGIAVVVVVLLGIWWFGRGDQVSKDTIKIGLSTPLTGEAASLGEGFSAGAELAVKEINDAGGIKGRRIELVTEDDKCSSQGVNAITKLVEIDKVVAIVGPLCSAAAGPGLPVAQKAGIPTLITASAPPLTKVGDYIFRNYPSDALEGKFVAEYIYNNLAKRKVAIIYTNNDWGAGLNEAFVDQFKRLGGEVTYDEGVPQDSKDLRTNITKAKASNPEVIYFPSYPANGIAGLKQMKELKVGVPILSGGGFDTEEIWKLREAEGVIYAIAKTDNPEGFQARIKNVTGKTPNVYTPYAYDAVKVLAQVIEKAGTDRKTVRNELTRTVYKGSVSGPTIEFDKNGDLKTGATMLKIIKNGKAEIYYQ